MDNEKLEGLARDMRKDMEAAALGGYTPSVHVSEEAWAQLLERAKLPPPPTSEEDFLSRFNITCKRCGSADVAMNIEQAGGYSEHTQWPASVQVGCNACKNNDWFADI